MQTHIQTDESRISTPQPGYSTFAEIDTRLLDENLRILKKQAGGIQIMAVVKADAYGHGVETIANHLVNAGIDRFMVATLDEALQLRPLAPEAQILVASPPHPENLDVYHDFKLDVSLTSVEVARAVLAASRAGRRLDVHAKIETGMNRLGMPLREAAEIVQLLLDDPNIRVAGIWSHLATAGDADKTFAQQQIQKTYDFVNQFPSFEGYLHVGNSGTLLNHRDRIGFRTNELIRLGGAILGIPASQRLAEAFGLRPVMSLKSRVIHLSDLQAGDSVSYGRIWIASKPTRIAVIGAGYADGYPSALSGKASVFINDRTYPVIGRVCMDMLMVDLGANNDRVEPGNEAVLFGKEHANIYDLATQAGLVHYEICCRIPKRVRRHFINRPIT